MGRGEGRLYATTALLPVRGQGLQAAGEGYAGGSIASTSPQSSKVRVMSVANVYVSEP